MARLRSARLTNDTLVHQIDDYLGELESDLAFILGIELDEDVTASAFSLDNSGRLTKDLIKWRKGLSNLGAQGLRITNSTNGTSAKIQIASVFGHNALLLGGLEPDTFVDLDDVPGLAFDLEEDDGYFPIYGKPIASGHMGLVPAIIGPGGGSYFLNGNGEWGTIGRPSETCVLTTPVDATTGLSTTFQVGATEKVQWNQDSFDPNGLHASNDDEIIIVNAGKYVVGAQVTPTPSGTDTGYMYLRIYRQRAAVDTLWAERTWYYNGTNVESVQADTIIDCDASDKLWVEVFYDHGGASNKTYSLANGIEFNHFWAVRVS